MKIGQNRRWGAVLAAVALGGSSAAAACGGGSSEQPTRDGAADDGGAVDGGATTDGAALDAPGSRDAPGPLDSGMPAPPPPTFVPATWVRGVVATSASVPVNILPELHLSGPVTITLSGLPSGVTADPLTLPAGTTSGVVTLHVDAAALPGDSRPTLTATAATGVHAEPFELLVQGARGTLDTTFGTNGIFDTGLPAGSPLLAWIFGASGITTDTDGSIFVWGEGTRIGWYVLPGNLTWIMHLSADGRPDPHYGAIPPVMSQLPPTPPGYAFPSFGVWPDQIIGVGLAPLGAGRVALSGEIVQGSASAGGSLPFVAELTPEGALDPAFAVPSDAGPDAAGGATLLHLPADDSGVPPSGGALAFDGDAGIVLPLGGSPGSLVRLRANDGTIDPTFGDAGYVRLDCGNCGAVAAFDPSGRLVAAQSDVVQRFTASGAPDPSFGTLGETRLPTPIKGPSIAFGRDGSIVLVGSTTGVISVPPSPNSIAMARMTAAGTLDPAFGSGGTVVMSLGAGPSYATSVAVLDDGSLAVAARIQSASGSAVSVARFTRDGQLDTAFGGGTGYVTIEPSDPADAIGQVTLLADGRILLAGTRCAPESSGSKCDVLSLVVARYWP